MREWGKKDPFRGQTLEWNTDCLLVPTSLCCFKERIWRMSTLLKHVGLADTIEGRQICKVEFEDIWGPLQSYDSINLAAHSRNQNGFPKFHVIAYSLDIPWCFPIQVLTRRSTLTQHFKINQDQLGLAICCDFTKDRINLLTRTKYAAVVNMYNYKVNIYRVFHKP